MKNAAKIFSTIGFSFLLLELFSYGILCALYALPGVLSSYDESFASTARILAIVFGVLAGLCLLSLILCLVGRNKLFTETGQGQAEHLAAGILSLNIFLILSGIFAFHIKMETK